MTESLFMLPDELILTPVLQTFPCRERQIRSLGTLLHPDAAPVRNLIIHGTSATGKTAVTSLLLHHLSSATPHLRHAIVDASVTITTRHLLETIVSRVARDLQWDEDNRRCETLAALGVELVRMLKYEDRGAKFRFVLVLDGIDKVREGGAGLLAGLARLSEIIPCLTTVFIRTAPPANALDIPSPPSLHFPPYTKSDLVQILSMSPPSAIPGASEHETSELWTRFCAAVYDALVKPAARSLPSFRSACDILWPRFVAPVEKGLYSSKEFSKLLVAARSHLQDESVLNPSIVSVRPKNAAAVAAAVASVAVTASSTVKPTKQSSDLSTLLPRAARMLLLAAYLAAHNAPRHDVTLFSTFHTRQRRRRRGASQATARGHRKIARKLLGAHSFVLERMLAIFAAVRVEWLPHARIGLGRAGLDGDLGMGMATLVSLRLLSRVGGGPSGGDVMDRGGKWRINVGWEVVRAIGRSVGVEMEEWLIE